VSDKVLCLNSVPKLGLEHSAYRIETGNKSFWIDSPSCFDRSLLPVDVIMFTHHHFLGASNQYRQIFSSRVLIHKLDSEHKMSREFTFDEIFDEDFSEYGIEAFHVDGHTPGFTFYIFEDILFICDYVHIYRDEMIFNPFGPREKTEQGGSRIREILEKRDIKTVCGFNYVRSYSYWIEKFYALTGSRGI
jgi:glyoxylase-like metal-dependent hydrolase (beta-lactamase superfamily II)